MRRRLFIHVTTGRRKSHPLPSLPTPSFGITRLKSLFDIIAASTIFLIVMGVPATVSHYSTLNIPISLLSYRRILEAGIIPAMIMVLFFSYFLYVERSASISNKKISELLIFPALPFVFPGVLIFIILFLSLYSYVFWSVGWILIRPLSWAGVKWKLDNLSFLLLGILCILLSLLFIYVRKRKKKNSQDKQLTPKAVPRSSEKIKHHPNKFSEELFFPDRYSKWLRNSIFYYITIPLMIVGSIYFIQITFSFFGFGWPHFIKSNLIWIFGLITGSAYAHFMTCGSVIPNASSKEISFVKTGRKISFGVFVLVCIITYSILIYPNLPRSLGGGKPQKVTIWATHNFNPLKKSETKDSLSLNQKNELIKHPNLLLIDIGPSDIIVCSESRSQMKGYAISRTIVKAISWEHRNQKDKPQ